MKKIFFIFLIFICAYSNSYSKEIKRIVVGNIDAKISIIAFESMTCSHCADFHKNVFPKLKEEFLDKGIAKIEFRHFPLDLMAFNASKVSQCRNDGNSDILESLYANQQKWVKGSSIEEANKNQSLEVDDVYAGSNYLILEQAHPCFDNIPIKNPEILPEDLIPYFNEEDLLG